MLQFIPQFGLVIALVGPAVAAGLSGGWQRLVHVLILYALIAAADGFLLQPVLMKRTAKVPNWASLLAPVVLGLLFSFRGVQLAPAILAVIYTYRKKPPGSRPLPPD